MEALWKRNRCFGAPTNGQGSKEVSRMFARVTTMRGHAQDGVVFMREQLVPKLQEHHDGFEGAMLLGDRTVGVGFALTFWTSGGDFVASREAEQQLFEMAAQAFDVQVDVNECDVAFSTFGVTLAE